MKFRFVLPLLVVFLFIMPVLVVASSSDDDDTVSSVSGNAAIPFFMRKANLSIVNFSVENSQVKINESFIVTMNIINAGSLRADEVTATLLLPSGLITSELTKNLVVLAPSGEYRLTWSVKAVNTGRFYLQGDLASESTSQVSATASVKAVSSVEPDPFPEQTELITEQILEETVPAADAAADTAGIEKETVEESPAEISVAETSREISIFSSLWVKLMRFLEFS